MNPAFGCEGKVFSRFSDIACSELKPVSVCGDNHREVRGAGQNVSQMAEAIPRTM
jgi:hypothetical protein